MKFNLTATAVIIILFGLTIYLGIVIGQMQSLNDDSQQYIDYWRHKTDSLSDENFKLYMKVYDLKDSIITLKYSDN
jgi:predicted PurR-regulated permease PerM